jgi:spore maturation protein CgeB
MNFAFFGSSLVSAYWNGAATYYRGLIKALAARGHRISFYEPDAFGRQQHRDLDDPDWARVVVYPPNIAAMEQMLDEAAAASDILVKCSGVGVLDRELEAAVAARRRGRAGPSVIFWDVDAPATLAAIGADPANAMRLLIPHYDAVLTYGGGAKVVDAYTRLGARLCVPIYNALDPDTHYPVRAQDEFAGSLSFLGNRLPDREVRVDEFFLAAAARIPDAVFRLGGSGWDGKPLPPNVIYNGHVYTRDHNAFNCSAKAVLNINRDSMASTGASPPTRIFEAAGAGACIISDRWDGIAEFLEPQREILLADSGAEVAQLLGALGAADARAIGAAARRHVLAAHTYRHRAAQVEAVLEGRDRWREAG